MHDPLYRIRDLVQESDATPQQKEKMLESISNVQFRLDELEMDNYELTNQVHDLTAKLESCNEI